MARKSPAFDVMRWRGKALVVAGLLVASLASAAETGTSTNANSKEDWEQYEIRVIRPRYFAKRQRLELGAELANIVNQTFLYTYLFTGLATFHFSEDFALELQGSYGFSLDKDEKGILKDEFSIQTELLTTTWDASGSLLWSPIYGKFQMPSGRLVYFDTFLAAGGGMTGVSYEYDWCDGNPTITNPPTATTVSYPGAVYGLGQRFFLNKAVSLKWDLRAHTFFYDKRDKSCTPETTASESDFHTNVMLQFGASRFL